MRKLIYAASIWFCAVQISYACHEIESSSRVKQGASEPSKVIRVAPAPPDPVRPLPSTVPAPIAEELTPEQLAEVEAQVSAIVDGGTEPDPAFETDGDVLITKPEELDDLLGEFPEE